jgi:hypothetical protein
MAQGFVGNMTVVDWLLQNKDGIIDVPMFVAMKDPTRNGMHETLGQQTNKLALNTSKAAPRETLLLSYSHSYSGFLLKDSKHVVHANQDVVRTEMAYLQDHSVIVSFVGEKPSHIMFNVWFAHLNQKVGGQGDV